MHGATINIRRFTLLIKLFYIHNVPCTVASVESYTRLHTILSNCEAFSEVKCEITLSNSAGFLLDVVH